ncbi:hypothetical protein UPYG_G00223860 [Umbra pygmaea]|uniref:Syncoilin n=1 Tax=Umbra pygmaea TaxID=75934 RepID=A0ABD0WUB6_UMBPY
MDAPMIDIQKGTEAESREDMHSEVGYLNEQQSMDSSSIIKSLNLSEGSMHQGGYATPAGMTEVLHCREQHVENPFSQKEATIDSVGLLFEECIEEVGRLESRRRKLVQELLQLERPMLRATEVLRGQLLEAHRVLTSIQLGCIHQHVEVGLVKSQLFVTTRDCIQSQLALASQQYEVAQSGVTQEELQAHIQSLIEEVAQLKEAQKNRLNTLKDRARRPSRPRAMSDVTICRRASLDIQKRLSGSMRNLEGWYEPRLLALLRRKQSGEDSLRKVRDVGRELKARLRPLQENVQRLELQRARLEHRMELMETERMDSLAQYKETVVSLEDTVRQLNLALSIQKNANKQLAEWKEACLQELDLHRGCTERTEKNTEVQS